MPVICIFGPPASGKSTGMGVVAMATSKGEIPFKVVVMDLEVFWFLKPETDDSLKLPEFLIPVIENYLNPEFWLVLGGDGLDASTLPDGVVKVLLIKNVSHYRDTWMKKKQRRGVGDDPSHSEWNNAKAIADGFLKGEWDYMVNGPEELPSLIRSLAGTFNLDAGKTEGDQGNESTTRGSAGDDSGSLADLTNPKES